MKITILNDPKTKAQNLLIPISNDASRVIKQIAQSYEVPEQELSADFKGDPGEVHTLYHGNSRIILLGIGSKTTPADLTRCFRQLSHKHSIKLRNALTISLLQDNLPEEVTAEVMIESAVNGLLLGIYQIGKYKSQPNTDNHPFEDPQATLTFLTTEEEESALQAAHKGMALATTQMSIFDLVNAPSNKKTPRVLAQWAINSGNQYNYEVKALEKAEIEALGLHALLAVNQGSPTPPYFIIIEYEPKDNANQTLPKVGLVGKGVTFDTGGLSIKPSSNMHFMKSDMGGAAAVLGTIEVASKLQLPIHLIGIIPTTDNSVDAKAVKPSDVIDSYSGKTIEVIDTDAEGRLILADGLAYMMKHYQPDTLIDLATLTGSAVRTLGYHAGALFSNNDELAEKMQRLGLKTGEKVWRLPLWDVYREDFKSDVADIRNYSGRPIAGAIGAAKFLETFTDGHPNWAHFDIAGVAFNETEFSMQKSASGFGIRLLVEYLQSLNT